MSASQLRQRLAAIFVADASGYTRLMAADARETVDALDAARAIFRTHIEANHGRVIDMAGDSVLAVFELASAAVTAALAIQQELTSRASAVPQNRRMRFRIGVHLGEIIEKDDGTVYGDGVNVAARIQSVAEVDSVCISQQVYDQVHGKIDVNLLELGRGEMKNVTVPVRVYRALLSSDRVSSPFRSRWKFRASQKRTRRQVLAGLGILIAGGIAWRLMRPSGHVTDPRAAQLFAQAKALTSYSSSHLENKANNEKAIALLEEATKIDPSFAEAHAKLGLAYVIRLFLFAPGETALQQKAYLAIERAFQLNPNLAEAYEARGRLRWTAFNHFPHQDAIRDFQQALKINPELDETHHYLGLVLLHVGLLDEGLREFQTAIRINPSNNGAQYRVGETYFYQLKYRDALRVFNTIDPAFNPDLHAYQSACSLFRIGRQEEALALMESTSKKYPGDKGGLLGSALALIYASTGEHAKAKAAIAIAGEKRGFGHFHHTEYNIACAYAAMSESDPALDWFEKAVHEGFNCYPLFEKDPSLANLRGVERFETMLADERKKWESYKAQFDNTSS